jgi:hypothetical protein
MIIWGCITKAISKFNGIHMKIPMTFFIENRTKNPKIHMESKKTPNYQSSLNQKRTLLEVSQYLTSRNTIVQ